jgi:hypothetical protein
MSLEILELREGFEITTAPSIPEHQVYSTHQQPFVVNDSEPDLPGFQDMPENTRKTTM